MPGPTVTVNPTTCTTNPPGAVHAPQKSRNGFVIFNATAPCTIEFQNPGVFNRSSAQLAQGSNQLNIETEAGSTTVSIAGCEGRTPRSLGAAGDPTDIIVP
jgi:hypothetical protein